MNVEGVRGRETFSLMRFPECDFADVCDAEMVLVTICLLWTMMLTESWVDRRKRPKAVWNGSGGRRDGR